MAPRWLNIGLCWLKLAPRCPRRPPKASQVRKMRPTWLQDGFQIYMFWPHVGFFEICFRTVIFQRFFVFRELGKHQFSPILGAKSDKFSIILAVLGRVCPKKSQDCCRMAYLSLSGPNMDPSWTSFWEASWVDFGRFFWKPRCT